MARSSKCSIFCKIPKWWYLVILHMLGYEPFCVLRNRLRGRGQIQETGRVGRVQGRCGAGPAAPIVSWVRVLISMIMEGSVGRVSL